MEKLRGLRKRFIVCLLCSALALAMTLPATAAQAGHAARPAESPAKATSQREFKFEVISIRPVKPGFSPYDAAPAPLLNYAPSPTGFTSTLNLASMVVMAYARGDSNTWPYTSIDNWPAYARDWYVIRARVADKDLEAWHNQSNKHELLRLAMQALLKERCKLALHEKPAQMVEYKLVVAKNGPHLKPSAPGVQLPTGGNALPSGGVEFVDSSPSRKILRIRYYGATMEDLVQFLGGRSPNHPVVDATGLTGRYDFTLQPADSDPTPEDPVYLFPVDPLGLRLRLSNTPGTGFVIDHIEKPSEN